MKLPYPVVLASASPRRRELLSKLVDDFEVVAADLDEELHTTFHPGETAVTLACLKARAVALAHPESLVIGADTVVAYHENPEEADLGADGWIQLAKPSDPDDAFRMLRLLSGRRHHVVTGVCVIANGQEQAFYGETEVEFRELSDAEIRAYVATGDPLDKAGAYGIQAGATPFVARLRGSKNNVIGLPTEQLGEVLQGFADK